MMTFCRNTLMKGAPMLSRGLFYVTPASQHTNHKDTMDMPIARGTDVKLLSADASVDPQKPQSGSFSWVIRQKTGEVIAKKFVFVPLVTDINLLESLASLHVLCAAKPYVESKVLRLYTDCKPWVLKLRTAKLELEEGGTVDQILSNHASGTKHRFRVHYYLASVFTKVMLKNYAPESGVYLIDSRENQVAHHLANSVRFYYWQKHEMFSEEIDEEFEVLNFGEAGLFQWLQGIEKAVEQNGEALI